MTDPTQTDTSDTETQAEPRSGDRTSNSPHSSNSPDSPGAPTEAEAEATADGGGLEAALADAAKFKELWMRNAADFDNFRKRSKREIEDAKKAGREELLRTVLPVFDNLERAVQSSQRATDVKAVADGLAMVLRQFTESLGRGGILRVPAIGHPFDPSVHEAIQQVETSDHPPGAVIAEVQPGYVQDGRLIRAAMVVVAKAKAEETPSN